jgi:hypothetical protein
MNQTQQTNWTDLGIKAAVILAAIFIGVVLGLCLCHYFPNISIFTKPAVNAPVAPVAAPAPVLVPAPTVEAPVIAKADKFETLIAQIRELKQTMAAQQTEMVSIAKGFAQLNKSVSLLGNQVLVLNIKVKKLAAQLETKTAPVVKSVKSPAKPAVKKPVQQKPVQNTTLKQSNASNRRHHPHFQKCCSQRAVTTMVARFLMARAEIYSKVRGLKPENWTVVRIKPCQTLYDAVRKIGGDSVETFRFYIKTGLQPSEFDTVVVYNP